MRLDMLALFVTFAAVLAWKYRADHRRERRWRAGLLDVVAARMPDAEKSLDGAGFPRWTVRLPLGQTIEIGLLRDRAGYRRLPSLWLTVTLRAPMLDAPRLDLLARAQDVEFHSPAADLPFHCRPPESWPAGLQVKSDRENVDTEWLRDEATGFFADPRAKELMLAPAGVRVVYQVVQARRARYLWLRAPVFDTTDADAARELTVRALAVRDAWLSRPAGLKQAA